MVMGSPAKVVRALSEEEQESIAGWAARYVALIPHYKAAGLSAASHPSLPGIDLP